RPERAELFHRRFEAARLQRLSTALLGAGDVGGFGARVTSALAADDRPQFGRPTDPPFRDLCFVRHRESLPQTPFRADSLCCPALWLMHAPLSMSPRAPTSARGLPAVCAARGSSPASSTRAGRRRP